MDVAQVHPYRSGQATPRSHGQVRTPTASGGHQIPGGDTRSATCPDYVAFWGMGDDMWRELMEGSDDIEVLLLKLQLHPNCLPKYTGTILSFELFNALMSSLLHSGGHA